MTTTATKTKDMTAVWEGRRKAAADARAEKAIAEMRERGLTVLVRDATGREIFTAAP